MKQCLTLLEGAVAALRIELGGLHADFAGRSARIDRVEAWLDRIEKRLGLVEA